MKISNWVRFYILNKNIQNNGNKNGLAILIRKIYYENWRFQRDYYSNISIEILLQIVWFITKSTFFFYHGTSLFCGWLYFNANYISHDWILQTSFVFIQPFYFAMNAKFYYTEQIHTTKFLPLNSLRF